MNSDVKYCTYSGSIYKQLPINNRKSQVHFPFFLLCNQQYFFFCLTPSSHHAFLFYFLLSSFAMSKTAGKKLHWRSRVQDSFVSVLGTSEELGIAIGGGADYGEFPFVTSAPAGGLTVGDIILEIGGTPVLGMTLGDVRGVLNSCPRPVRVKTVSPGTTQHTNITCII